MPFRGSRMDRSGQRQRRARAAEEKRGSAREDATRGSSHVQHPPRTAAPGSAVAAAASTASAAGPVAAAEPRTAAPQDVAQAVPWLGVVAVVFTVIQMAVVTPGSGLGWDETVYVSQVSPHHPAAFFSAPRARGITFLVAPLVAISGSTESLRGYLALLSGAGLYLAFRVWRPIVPAPVPALAGGLFAGLWVTLFYGPRAMPNLWVAFGAVAATGCFLRAVRDGTDRAALAGLAGSVAFTALLRPSDAAWLALPLAACALAVRLCRSPVLLASLAAGLLAGAAPWIVEAYTSYGGLVTRLRRADEIQGSMGWYFALDDQVRALQGQTLCRPCTVPWRHPVTGLWLFALPLLTAVGVRAAIRRGRPGDALVPTLAALAMAAPYALMIGYAAPRFLLPVYALVAVPVALGVAGMAGMAGAAGSAGAALRRPAVAVLAALAFTGHQAVQFAVLGAVTHRSREQRQAHERIAAELYRLGVRPPCVLSGDWAVPLAYPTGCASRQVGGHDGSITGPGLAALAATRPVAVLVAGNGGPPPYAAGWRVRQLPDLQSVRDLRAYLSPAVLPGRPAGR